MRSRLFACRALALGVASLLFGGVAPAGAQEPEETVEVLRGNLNDTKDTRERDDDEPVEGVSIFVRSAAGEDIDSAESDADGRWEIERSEERRVGKEGVRTCRSRWSREN